MGRDGGNPLTCQEGRERRQIADSAQTGRDGGNPLTCQKGREGAATNRRQRADGQRRRESAEQGETGGGQREVMDGVSR
ncbi:unnamed protein product [Mycena citricolor]|uniref:Uncharacterized protein n=1 Tax=Mycena citricolor TaxID=2018698 RepID=A0AAD2H0W5_9AGAR|nr:unnamed protein product [Mycena citricolor]